MELLSRKVFKSFFSFVVDHFVYPPICLLCHEDVQGESMLCGTCWLKNKFVSDFSCRLCRRAFSYQPLKGQNKQQVCEECWKNPPAYDFFHTVFDYNSPLKALIIDFKHHDNLMLVRPFSAWLYRTAADIWSDVDVITGVPLHWKRLCQRFYNQSFVLAERLGTLSRKPVDFSLLERSSFERTQKNLSKREREHNVKTAFRCGLQSSKQIEGKTILIVDDVCTTGATLNACANALKQAGAKRVYAITLARVFPQDPEEDHSSQRPSVLTSPDILPLLV